MKNLFKKYLTQKVRNIISICIIIFGLIYIINYSFYRPTYINKYIAMNIYKEPANNAFTDQNFYNCVIDNYNRDNKTSLAYTENLSDEQLSSIEYLYCPNKSITDVTGIQKMSMLKYLDLVKNKLTNIDVSNNTLLVELELNGNKLTSLDLSNNTLLVELYVGYNQLTSLDLSNNLVIDELGIYNNQLTSLDLSQNTELTYLDTRDNQLTSLDLSKNLKLETLIIENNNIKDIDISDNLNLKILVIGNNEFSILNLNNNVSLTSLMASNNQLASLDVSKNIALKVLYLSNNQLTNLDLSTNTALEYLDTNNNQLTSLDVSKNTKLKKLYTYNNQLTSLDLSQNTELTYLYTYNNQLTSLDLSQNTELTYLDTHDNQLTSLDLSQNVSLTELRAEKNQLIELNVSGVILLKYLSAFSNKLTNLDLSTNTALVSLDISRNKLTSLDLSQNVALEYLMASENLLASINLSNNNKLGENFPDYRTFLRLQNNNFNNVLIKYVGDSGNVNSAVKLPSHLEHDITWKSSDESIAVSNSDGNITTKKVGTVNIVGTNKYYTTKTIVNVFEMTSDKYDIDNENLYIYVGNDNNVDTIKNNINVPDYVIPNIDLVNNKLKLVSNDEVIKEFKIIRINSNNYKIGSDYIYTRHYSDISGLSCYNCNASIEDNNVIIKYNNIEIDRFKLVKFNNKYTLYCIGCSDDAGIYTGIDNDEEIINNLAVINGNTIIDNNILKITYNDKVLEEFDIRGFSTNYKILDNNVLYTGFNKFNINYISYRGNKVSGKYSDNKFTVLYNNSAKMDSYDVITLIGNNISISRKNIDTEEIDYDTFIDNLSVIDNISYKVIYNNEEVTSGDIPRNSILNIYYNNELIDKYYINRDYIFDIDDDISVLEEESIIYDINVGFTKNNLLDKVNTNGETYMLDKNMKPIEDNNIIKTGYIFRTIFENDLDNPLDYKLSVRGDVLGTGELSRENAQEIAKHIIKKNAIKEKEYLLAADYDNDGNIKMNDVIKMLRDKRNKENP